MRSAAYLAEHLAEVPAIVVPTIIGVHDGSGRPGLFDSVIQAVWSFSVALRARGLGSAWTTANLSRQDDIAALLGIPGGMTQIAMLPVAWTKGTDFKTAPRYPAREIAYFDGFGRTWESGPSDPPRFADGPGTVVETDVKASAAVLWPYVTDIDFSAQFSDEFTGGRWADDTSGPAVGARFVGSNANAGGTWEVDCFVDRCETNREFGWVTADPDNPAARWRFEASSIAGATRLRYSVVLGPGPSRLTTAIAQRPDDEAHLIAKRIETLRTGMTMVVEGMREAAERDAARARARRNAGAPPPPLS